MNIHRQRLFEIYQAALAAVRGDVCTKQALQAISLAGPVSIVAIGKAGASMAEGAKAVLGKQVSAGLIITKSGHCGSFENPCAGFQCLEAGHPLPDERSMIAGNSLLSFLAQEVGKQTKQSAQEHTFVFLLSGGASALVEVPIKNVSLADLQRANTWLLGSGIDIVTMNRVRTALSSIKGGRLAKYLGGQKAICLMISDVPDDQVHVIGSGLLSPEPAWQAPLPDMPDWLRQLVENAETAPKQTDECFQSISTHIVATLDAAKQAAAMAGQALGYSVVLHQHRLCGDAFETGQLLASYLREADPALHIWGGETTVSLPTNPGHGGRNQHLALAAATVLNGCDDCWLLAAGTDGSDGPTAEAGALVDGGTVIRGQCSGKTAEQAIRKADSGSFLSASHDLICTGPTGTNVTDLVFGLKVKPAKQD